MEALAAIVFQFAIIALAPVWAVTTVVVSALFELALFVANKLFRAIGLSAHKAPPLSRSQTSTTAAQATMRAGPAASSSSVSPLTRLARKVLRVVLVVGVLGGTMIVVIDAFYFAPALRWAFGQLEQRSGYALHFTDAQGSIIRGRLSVTDASVKRNTGDGIAVDLTIGQLDLDLRMTSLLTGPFREFHLNNLSLSEVRGELHLPTTTLPASHAPGTPTGTSPRRRFTTGDAHLEGIDIRVLRAGKAPIELVIEYAHVAPFDSRNALFYLFFRSNLEARVNTARLNVATKATSPTGRHTQWALQDLPIDVLAPAQASPPFTWFSGGTLSATVEDRWELDDLAIEMDWRLALRDITLLPANAVAATERPLLIPLARYVDAQQGRADLAFTLQLDRHAIEGEGSDDLRALLRALADAVLSNVVTRPPAETGTASHSERPSLNLRRLREQTPDR